MVARCASLLLAGLAVCASALSRGEYRNEDEGAAAVNPIRKVVSLLQAMQKRVSEEGEKEKELYEKFMCYCKTGGSDLTASIAASNTKIPAVGSDIESAESQKVQAEEALKKHQTERAAAKAAMAEATGIREKEAAAFAAERGDYDSNIAAIAAAVAALEKGMSGGFLQTSGAAILKRLALNKQDMLDIDRQTLLAFLEAGGTSGYSPKSGEITGILKELGGEMAKNLGEATSQEKAAIKSFEELMHAKTKEVAAITAAVETKTQRIGELAVSIVQMKNDLTETEAALLADQKYLADLEKSCGSKTSEWEERMKTRSEELVALADTIKLLNDDDALDLFKATLPTPATAMFVQVDKQGAAAKVKALAAIRGARAQLDASHVNDRTNLDLIALALADKGKKAAGFESVIKMIDNMVGLLKQEQVDDDNKKEYCGHQFDFADDKKKGLQRAVSDLEAAMATAEDGLATLKGEISALDAGIQALDKSVTEATQQRQNENRAFSAMMASDSAAVQLIGLAKNRLRKFYQPKLYKSPPKVELEAGERIFVSNGGTVAPTPAPGGIANTGIFGGAVLAQVSAHVHMQHGDAPPPPPETFGAYVKKGEESTGVMAMLDLLVKDLQKEMAVAQTQEKDAQSDYETMMTDSSAKRVADTRALQEKKGSKADMEVELEQHKGSKVSETKELAAVVEYIGSLHSECDWLLQYFDVRKEARAGEIDSLNNAKAVLSGSDMALLQKGFLGKRASM